MRREEKDSSSRPHDTRGIQSTVGIRHTRHGAAVVASRIFRVAAPFSSPLLPLSLSSRGGTMKGFLLSCLPILLLSCIAPASSFLPAGRCVLRTSSHHDALQPTGADDHVSRHRQPHHHQRRETIRFAGMSMNGAKGPCRVRVWRVAGAAKSTCNCGTRCCVPTLQVLLLCSLPP